MKRILLLSNGNDILTNGGIQTFARTLGEFFFDKIVFLQFLENKNRRIYRKKNLNIHNIYSRNIILKILNKLTNQKIKHIIIKKYIKKLINKEKIQTIILSSPLEINCVGNLDCKKILVQHTSIDNLIKSKNYYGGEEKLIKKSREMLDYFIALSKYETPKIKERIEITEEKIKVIRHCSTIPINFNEKERKKKIVMITRLSREKRIDLAIEGMELLEDYELNIYGDGSEEKMLKNLIAKKKLTNVYLHGPTDKVMETLDENSIFLMTSDFEGYPMGAIEALRRGLPIILRKTFPSSEDIIQENGVLLDKEWDKIEFAKAVENCYQNFEKYSKKSIELGRRHDKSIIKKEWESILE